MIFGETHALFPAIFAPTTTPAPIPSQSFTELIGADINPSPSPTTISPIGRIHSGKFRSGLSPVLIYVYAHSPTMTLKLARIVVLITPVCLGFN